MRKILVVEDSSAMRGLIASIVDEVGDCEVVEVSNGFEALRRLPREVFALVITDINMPDINGLELLSFIRKSANSAATPVLIVTSEGSEKDRDRGIALGANAYVTKPFVADELLKTVRRLLA
jgi:two-component system chemotaxis response regulator CheY